jgi:hypothetical protein
MAVPVSFRWDEEFVRRLDEARGLVPRSAFVRAAVDRAIGEDEGSRRLVEMMQAREKPNTVAEVGAAVGRVFSESLPDVPSPLNDLLGAIERSKADVCPRHPDAGFTRVKGDSRLWCAEPGCSASFEERA